MKKKILSILLRIVISAGLLGYFLFSLAQKNGGFGPAAQQLIQAFAHANLIWLLPAASLHIVGFSLISFRWKLLLKAQDVQAGFGRLFQYYFMAAFFNLVLPSSIGGDAVRAMESRRLVGNATMSITVVIVERLTGLMALILISATAFAVKLSGDVAQTGGIWLFLLFGAVAFLILIGLIHPKVTSRFKPITRKLLPAKIQQLLETAIDAVTAYYKQPLYFFSGLAVSIVFQLNMVLYYYLIARALMQDPNPLDFAMKIPLMIFLLMVVPAINGLGVRTAGFKELMNFPAAGAIAAEMIDLGLRIAFGLAGGILYLFHRRTPPNN